MSNFTKDEQTNIVKKALELEEAIIDGDDLLAELADEQFRAAPRPPVHRTVTADYSSLPKVELSFDAFLKNEVASNRTFMSVLFADHPFLRGLVIFFGLIVVGCLFLQVMVLGIIIMLLAFAVVPAALYYWYSKRQAYNAKINELNAALPNTPEYIKAKAEIDNEVLRQQQNLDCQYAKEKAEYENIILPQYEKELAIWTAEHKGKMEGVAAKIGNDFSAQTQLYESTKIIPMQYRDIDALTYIYELMSTSNYNIKEAIDMYDKAVQRAQESTRNREMSRQNALLEEQNYHLNQQNMLSEEQNYLLEEQNKISEKARREANVRGAVTAVQNRNTNKYLKNLSEKFDK